MHNHNLAGEWQLTLDPTCEGLDRGWTTGRFPADRAVAVQVPSLWNLTYPDYEGVAFYRKVFHCPEAYAGKVALIHFEGVCYRSEAWLNGHYLGSHAGAYTPFWFELTQALRPGQENELILRVAGLSKTKAVDGILLKHVPTSKQSWYYTHGGPWGNIWLEPRPWVCVQSLVLVPDLRGERVCVEVTLHNRLPQVQNMQLEIQITAPDGRLAAGTTVEVSATPGVLTCTFPMHIPNPLAWRCDAPHLYRASVTATPPEGESDRQEDHFGMRDFTVDNGQYLLNGEPIFIKGVLLQPHYPITHVVPPDPELMLREITLMKEAGFNLIRSHVRPSPPGYLDLTDRMGMLVYAETSLAWIRESPRMLDYGEQEIRAHIRRDRNHPSVVIWGILEENPPASALASEYFMTCARALDPTRVVLDNSGSSLVFDQDFGWIDRTYVLPDRDRVKQKILDIHAYMGNIIPPGVYDWVRDVGSGKPSTALVENDLCTQAISEEFDRVSRDYSGKVFISEFGGAGMMDLGANLSRFGDRTDLLDAREIQMLYDSLVQGFTARGLERIFGSVEGMLAASQTIQAGGVTRQMEALLCNPRISGFVLTQLNDVGWEFHAGILDTWRQPKKVYASLPRLNAPDCLILRPGSPVVTCGERLPLEITLVKRKPSLAGGQVVLELSTPEAQPQRLTQVAAPASAGIHSLGSVSLETGPTAAYTISARYESDGQVLAVATETVLALPPTPIQDVLPRMTWLGTPPGLDPVEGERSPSAPAGTGSGGRTSQLLIAPFPADLSPQEWDTLLETAAAGGAAVVGPLHRRDAGALEALRQRGIDLKLEVGTGSWIGCFHWVPASPLFEGLPGGGFAGEAYVALLPHYSMVENGGDVLAGAVRSRYTVDGPSEFIWYSDIEVLPFGQGRLVFCQYRLFDQLVSHPVARRLFANLVQTLTSPA
jgi:beta-galactosidase